MENVKDIIKNYSEQIDGLEKQIKQVQKQIFIWKVFRLKDFLLSQQKME